MLQCFDTIGCSSIDPLQSFGVQSRVLKNINVLILKLRDLTPSQFDSIDLNSVLPALSHSHEKAIIPECHMHKMHITRRNFAQYRY